MKIHTFDLPLRHTFTISRESIDVQPTVIVELQQGGQSGFGEATANRYYGFSSAAIVAALEAVRGDIEARADVDPPRLWSELDEQLRVNRFAQCALDQAAYDLWGKLQGQPVHRLWGLSTERVPVSNYTIGIDRIEVMVEKLGEFGDWPVFKIKLGTSHDLDIIRRLRQETDAVFRVDANCGWQLNEAIENSSALAELGVEFIEQPLPADRWDDMATLRAESALPVIADESCCEESDVDRCAAGFHGINIKLVKCGGLTPARRMIEQARTLGLNVMVGCMTESTVGISAIAQLLPLLDYVDMDGAVLLSEDIANGVRVERGVCLYPDENGCGVQLLKR